MTLSYSDTFHLHLIHTLVDIFTSLLLYYSSKESYYLQSLAWMKLDIWCVGYLQLIVIYCVTALRYAFLGHSYLNTSSGSKTDLRNFFLPLSRGNYTPASMTW